MYEDDLRLAACRQNKSLALIPVYLQVHVARHRRKQLGIGDVDIDTSASPTMVVCDKVVEQNMTSFVSRFYVQYGYIAWLNLSSLSRELSITLSPTHFMGCSYRKVR